MYGIEILTNTEVKKVINKNDSFELELADLPAGRQGSRLLTSDYLCIASGGYPKSSMFEWLRQLGHSIEEPVPSLFTFNLPAGQAGMPGHTITKLMGVSVGNVSVKIVGSKLEQHGSLLITHWGFSGPAVLKLSAWGARELAGMNYDFKIMVNWLPDYNEQQLAVKFQSLRFDSASQKVINRNAFGLPARLWEFLVNYSGVKNETRWADLPAKDQNKLIKNLCSCEFSVKGKTTFKEEFVTAGGIKLNEVDYNTMMSKKVHYLFFAGEILDVDGVTGGFNFQHAWTSAFIAGEKIAALAQ